VVIEDAYFTAPDGPMVADLRLTGSWPWIVVALAAAIITVGWLVLS
jgi:hypothetical protein